MYFKEVPLHIAKSINGLRAVFGETYPDPVRVVSVGFNVDEILLDTANPTWAETSIEFCGGTHVNKTGDIKRLVVLEESSIAKGIRRIVCVTGDEAFQVQRVADELDKKIADIKQLPFASLDSALKGINKDIDEAVLPYLRKYKLRQEFTALKKEFDEQDKARKAKEMKEAVDDVKSFFDSNPEAWYLVKVLPVGGNTKALAKAVEHVKGRKDKAAMLMVVDGDSGKVSHQCVVPKALVEKGFKATDWADVVVQKVGGKKGGKDDFAQGSGTELSGVEEAVALASEFARKLTVA